MLQNINDMNEPHSQYESVILDYDYVVFISVYHGFSLIGSTWLVETQHVSATRSFPPSDTLAL